MRVLVVSSVYRNGTASGENVVVASEISLLRQAGVEVVPFLAGNPAPGRTVPRLRDVASAGMDLAGIGPGAGSLVNFVRTSKPDIVHFHNLHPHFMEKSLALAGDLGIPMIQSIHNFRRTCLCGTHRRDGHPCTDCLGHKWSRPAVQHGCYRHSVAQSAIAAMTRGRYSQAYEALSAFIAPSDSLAERCTALTGSANVRVIPHSTSAVSTSDRPGKSVLCLGRLDEDKGIPILIKAWQDSSMPDDADLVIVGDGPLRPVVEGIADRDRRVRYLPWVDQRQRTDLLDDCRLVVVPSLWEEPFGLAVIEAYAAGRAVLSTGRGALRELSLDADFWAYDGSVEGLTVRLPQAYEAAATAGAQARARWREDYTHETKAGRLTEAYQGAIVGRVAPPAGGPER